MSGHVINPDKAPTMGSQVTVSMKSDSNPLANKSFANHDETIAPTQEVVSGPAGWAAESQWELYRTLHYAFRVVLAAAISTLLVLRTDTIEALDPVTNTASFLMPVFAIIAAEPSLGGMLVVKLLTKLTPVPLLVSDTLRSSIGCAVASALYGFICWTQIQLMNQWGIGDSAWAYLFCIFFTSFGCLLSPCSVYVKRIFMGKFPPCNHWKSSSSSLQNSCFFSCCANTLITFLILGYPHLLTLLGHSPNCCSC